MSLDTRTKIFGWLADYNGCGFYRVMEPLNNLPIDQFSVQYSPALPRDHMYMDVIIGQRVYRYDDDATPVLRWTDICDDPEIKAIYEIDDNLFRINPANPAYEEFMSKMVHNNIIYAIRKADLVQVSTSRLADLLDRFNPNIVVLPNYVDESLLQVPRPLVEAEQGVTIGWAGSSTHLIDFMIMKEALCQMLDRHPNVQFMTIGGNYAIDINPEQRTRRPWVRNPAKLYKYISQFDIGIAPLAPGTFNNYKSYIKALEYAALGIPAVISAENPYLDADFLVHGDTCFFADSPAEWNHYLTILIKDPELRKQMGINARSHAKGFTIQRNIEQFAEVYAR